MLLVFVSDAKGLQKIAKPKYSDRRVSCLILSHSKFEKRTDGVEGSSRRVVSSSFCSGKPALGADDGGCGKLDRERL